MALMLPASKKSIERKAVRRVRFSFIGHLGRHKGVQTIIEALQYIEEKEQVRVNLVGEGELRSELEEIVQKCRCEKRSNSGEK